MQKSKVNSSRIVQTVLFVDYKPAELKKNKRWEIVYYAKHPVKQVFERFRVAVPQMKMISERTRHAQTIVVEINKKLQSGWLPYYSQIDNNDFKTFDYCKKLFLEQTEKEVKTNIKRPDTLRSYKSYLNMIDKFCTDKPYKINLMFDFNKAFVVNYLDWIYFDRKNSTRTYNNHLLFIGTFVNFCINHGWLKENFTTTISKKREGDKVRQILTEAEKTKLKEYKTDNPEYFVLCMLTYFCFVRRTELTKLKVSDIDLKNNFITLDENISKNRKTETVTIPNDFLLLLVDHLKDAKKTDWLFGKGFKAGALQIDPKRVSEKWEKFRQEKNVAAKYQFYSLKDTGITDLLLSGIPAIKVRDQARHHDLRITESYTQRNKTCDDIVRNSAFSF